MVLCLFGFFVLLKTYVLEYKYTLKFLQIKCYFNDLFPNNPRLGVTDETRLALCSQLQKGVHGVHFPTVSIFFLYFRFLRIKIS